MCFIFFFFNDTATTEIYTYDTLFPYTTLFRSIEEFIPLASQVAPMVVKTTGGDYLMVWRLGGLPCVGRDEWEIEHRHNTFNRLLQTLRAPDFVNVAFWVHDIRRKRKIRDRSKFRQAFNQEMSDAYFEALSSQKIMQNELYLTIDRKSTRLNSELQSLIRTSYAV